MPPADLARPARADRLELRLFLAQRLSAMVLAVLVPVHIGLIVWATRHEVSAADILGRTRGSVGWMLFYGAFVLAAAVHAPIGLRTVLRETVGWRGASLDVAALLFGLLLLLLGLRAVGAVT